MMKSTDEQKQEMKNEISGGVLWEVLPYPALGGGPS
jgi:hypothetical protein